MLDHAKFEWDSNHALQQLGRDVIYQGYVQCFCDDRLSEGDPPDKAYNGE